MQLNVYLLLLINLELTATNCSLIFLIVVVIYNLYVVFVLHLWLVVSVLLLVVLSVVISGLFIIGFVSVLFICA